MGVGEEVSEYLGLVPERGLFVAKHMVASTMSALAFGVCGGLIGANLAPTLGPLIPYLLGSSFGFSLSSYVTWQTEKSLATHFVQRYPEIMQHHFVNSFPGLPFSINFRTLDLSKAHVGTATWAILVAQSAQNDVKELESRRIASILDKIADEETESM